MKFKNKPELKSEQVDRDELAKKFLSGADMPASMPIMSSNSDTEEKTWRNINLKKDTIVFSLRLPKKDMQQLKFISKETGMSINTLCLLAIQANNKKMLKEIEEN